MLGVKKELNLRSNTAALDAKGRLFVLYAPPDLLPAFAQRGLRNTRDVEVRIILMGYMMVVSIAIESTSK